MFRIRHRLPNNFKRIAIITLSFGAILFLGAQTFKSLVFGAGQNDVTSTMSYLGKPFTKGNQYYNNVWDIQSYNGRLYYGHGDWAYNAGPIPVVSMDLSNDSFVQNEYSVDDESIWRYKVLNGELYIPGSDARTGNWNWGQYYKLDANGWRMSRSIPYALHVLDMEYFDGKLWAGVGAEGSDSTKLRKYELQSSSDGGATWDVEMPTTGSACYNRCYTLFQMNGNLYGAGTIYGRSGYVLEVVPGGTAVQKTISFSGSNIPTASAVINRTENFNGNILFILQGYDTEVTTSGDGYHTPVAMVKASSLTNGTSVIMPEAGAIPTDILVRDNRVYVLANIKHSNTSWTNIVYYSSDLNTWTEAFRFDTGAMARSFEENKKDFYIGLGGTYAARNSDYGKIYKIPASLWSPKAEITSFTAPTGPVASSGNIILAAEVANVTACNLNNSVGNVSITGVAEDGIYASGTISYSAPAKSSYELVCTDENGSTVSKKVYTILSDAQSNVADLASLSVAEGTLYPQFDTDTTEYALAASSSVPALAHSISAITINYAKSDISATVNVSSNASALAAGKNTITITVTAQDGVTQKVYTIIATKTPAIASLSVKRNGGNNEQFTISPAFDPNNSTVQYQATATTTSSTYAISALSADLGATITIVNPEGGATAAFTGTTAAAGTWTSRLLVIETADGVRQEYKFRIRGLSNVATLSELAIKSSDNATTYELDPAFVATTQSYAITVPNEVTSLNVAATTTNSGANMVVSGNNDLPVGTSAITVVVTSEGGTVTKTYTISVTRETGVAPEKIAPTTGHIDYMIPTGLIYDASARSVSTPTAKSSITGLGVITVKYVGVDGTSYAESVDAPTNAGTYDIYADIAEGDSYAAGKINLGSYSIAKKTISISGATVGSKIYDGTTSAIISNVTYSGLEGSQTLTQSVDFVVVNPQFNSADAGTNKTVTATVTLSASSKANNYTLSSTSLSVGSQTIHKASASSVSQQFEVKSELANSYTFDLRELLSSSVDSSAVASYMINSVSGDIYSVAPSISGYTLTLPVVSTSAGNTKSVITIDFTSNNYEISAATLTINVTERIPVSISGISVTSRAYNGTPITASGTAVFTNTSTQGAISSLTPILTWKTNSGDVLSDAPTNAGTYELVVSADDGADYSVADLSIGFTISKASQTVAFTCQSSGNIGDQITLSATASSGLSATSFSSNNFALATINGNVATLVGEGSVMFTATQAGNSNYNSASNSCTVQINAVPANYAVIQYFPDFDGTGDRVAVINADAIGFARLLLNNEEVSSSNYSVASGSTIITLFESYLSTLSDGDYEFAAVFSDGTSVPLSITILTKNGDIGAPVTGVITFISDGGYFVLCVIPAIIFAGFVITKKLSARRKQSDAVFFNSKNE